MKMIAVMNVKGGVGKTVTVVNMAEILASLHGKRVLVIDADPQGDATAFYQADVEDGFGLASILGGYVCGYDEILRETGSRNVDLIPSTRSCLTWTVFPAGNIAARPWRISATP